jgi:hypothetical protein
MAALVAGTSARPVFDVMLYGNVTGRPYGWARPQEIELMLAGGEPGPDSCPPAEGGCRDDWYLVPAAGDFFFWLAWHQRRGQAGEWLAARVLPEPLGYEQPMTFYTGVHRPWWLWSGQAGYPLCVSYSTLRKVRRLRRGLVPWILDSRGFSELSQHGRWTIPARDYVRDVARYDQEIGGLQWAAPQDWMCEDEVIHGGMLGQVRCAGTGLSVAEHQRRTVASFAELTALWPRFSDRPCPFVPVLQGDSPDAYLACYQMYLDAGVLLGEEHQLAGVGSVCRLQSTSQIAAIARALAPLNLDLHWFGLKLAGLTRPELHRDLAAALAAPRGSAARHCRGGTQSLDSAAWSLDARYGTRLPGCTHISPKTGRPGKCTNCPRYAAWWRDRVLAAMASPAAAQGLGQPELFGAEDLDGQGWAPARRGRARPAAPRSRTGRPGGLVQWELFARPGPGGTP